MTLGCIAGDYTGATDLSSMLVRAGRQVVQVFGPEASVELDEADAVVLRLDVSAAAESEADFGAVVSQAVAWCWESRAGVALIASGWDPGTVAAMVALLGETKAAHLTESLFAAIAGALAARGVTRMIVAGGETSGAVINALGIDAIRIGEAIAPGVPCVYTLRAPALSVALKPGNFGGVGFFLDAMRKLTGSGG